MRTFRAAARSMSACTHRRVVAWAQMPILLVALSAQAGTPHPAFTTFNTWCFKAGQTEATARATMNADTAPFTLTFWDDSLEPRPADAPTGIERRCEIAFDGDHAASAITALHIQMATPPKFGNAILLPKTHQADEATHLIQGRELPRGRVAVGHIATRDNGARTFMAVDRLYAGPGLPEQQ